MIPLVELFSIVYKGDNFVTLFDLLHTSPFLKEVYF